MQEIAQGFQAVVSVIASLLFSTAYMIGGRSESFLGIRARLWKRLIAPLLLASSAVIFSILAHRINWATACCAIWFIPQKYGAKKLFEKIVWRLLQSIMFTAPSLVFGIFGGNLFIAIIQFVLGAVLTVILGSFNPVEAAEEEALIAFFNTCLMGMILLG